MTYRVGWYTRILSAPEGIDATSPPPTHAMANVLRLARGCLCFSHAGWLSLAKEKLDLAKFFRDADRKMRELRRRLLLRLANHLPDHLLEARGKKLGKTWAAFGFDYEEAAFVNTVIEDLRLMWSRDVPLPLKQPTINVLLHTATRRPGRDGVYAPLPFGYLTFGVKNFPGQVVIGILENWHRMERCGNPKCLVPYFLAKRSTQRYCERGECTRFALRTKALKYWRKKHGKSTEGGKT